mmetsp:Transcript_43322/g.70305  ORF Transcript_43322/g.70305 Transcript_43322/m.70305 type:complete len:139 (-) Transcript_43322:97-513(-)
MSDLALDAAGASVIVATSFDDRHPPESIVDGRDDTFWSTTGLFPQEFIVSFNSPVQISRIRTVTAGVRKLVIEKTDSSQPTSFEKVLEVEYADKKAQKQQESHQVPKVVARFLKFQIASSWDDFVAIYKISVEGGAAS